MRKQQIGSMGKEFFADYFAAFSEFAFPMANFLHRDDIPRLSSEA